jgi:hypothetical protein
MKAKASNYAPYDKDQDQTRDDRENTTNDSRYKFYLQSPHEQFQFRACTTAGMIRKKAVTSPYASWDASFFSAFHSSSSSFGYDPLLTLRSYNNLLQNHIQLKMPF